MNALLCDGYLGQKGVETRETLVNRATGVSFARRKFELAVIKQAFPAHSKPVWVDVYVSGDKKCEILDKLDLRPGSHVAIDGRLASIEQKDKKGAVKKRYTVIEATRVWRFPPSFYEQETRAREELRIEVSSGETAVEAPPI